MQQTYGRYEYATSLAQDDAEGWIAVELRRRREAEWHVVARVVYWDADGQFGIELKVPELPLHLVEEVIAEARSTIQLG